ncbi:cytochrome P450 [Mycobacterium sp. IS-1590]|uniref:cytochrome P450 n=1 Tax=Mycobacterium sp. IS-1590 TaxID=1772286 RepID=UPI001E2892A5|nr:cytochrome P450 [Mycobacterium sp. IS-1590]
MAHRRGLVLGDRARDDELITDALMRSRKAGNWSFLSPPHYRARAKFVEGLYRYVEGPERARAVEDAGEPDRVAVRPYLRGCVLESVRLWPTTPTILRDTTEDTRWADGSTIAKGAGLMIVTPAFHRDDELLPFAHSFSPQIWLDGTVRNYPQLVPFSAGPAECPGRNLVLLVTSTLLAQVFSALERDLPSEPKPVPERPLPMTLNQLTLQFGARRASQSVSSSER